MAIPVVIVVLLQFYWGRQGKTAIYALARMLAQLMIVGYFLAYLFEEGSAFLIVGVVAVMTFLSSWIALRTVAPQRRSLLFHALFSILIGGGFTLALVTQGALSLEPWFYPRFFIPLAGMIFSNAMNSVSLAAERYASELGAGQGVAVARSRAFQAALIPVINSLFAVGLVSVPGMMTGQILSGVEPTIAARYQILVMCMVYGSAGLSSALFLWSLRSLSGLFLPKAVDGGLSRG